MFDTVHARQLLAPCGETELRFNSFNEHARAALTIDTANKVQFCREVPGPPLVGNWAIKKRKWRVFRSTR